MSMLEDHIKDSIKAAIQATLRVVADGSIDVYPGGRSVWLDAHVEMRMNEIGQWLQDPRDVREHLDDLARREG